jgi:hypothetical protein
MSPIRDSRTGAGVCRPGRCRGNCSLLPPGAAGRPERPSRGFRCHQRPPDGPIRGRRQEDPRPGTRHRRPLSPLTSEPPTAPNILIRMPPAVMAQVHSQPSSAVCLTAAALLPRRRTDARPSAFQARRKAPAGVRMSPLPRRVVRSAGSQPRADEHLAGKCRYRRGFTFGFPPWASASRLGIGLGPGVGQAMNGMSSAGMVTKGRIMSRSSCSRMWQWYM